MTPAGRCDHFIAGAAMIGGISYFHTYAYDLLATNERIIAASATRRSPRTGTAGCGRSPTCPPRWSSRAPTSGRLTRGSSGDPPPLSSYGFQKLAVEYFARAAWDQYRLPYTLVRPFNCVGIGESRALGDQEILSGNVQLAMSHVVPDLVQKVLKGQDPLHILGSGDQVRHYTYGGDLAAGVVTAMEHETPSTRTSTCPRRRARPCGSWPSSSGARSRAMVSRCGSPTTTRSNTTSSAGCPTRRRRRSARLRGHHHARGDARRGHPLDRRGRQGRTI